MSITDLDSVTRVQNIIHDILQQIIQKKAHAEPPVIEAECAQLLQSIKDFEVEEDDKALQSAAIETVFREKFDDLVASTDIDDHAFVQVWILLDVVTILSDNELCEAGFGFYLVEELLDSQTIAGCRKVFDYLESRRERMTAKHFKNKNLVILRCCNELLRRLSRAEDTVFCGRVFIFLFQSFPLGDRSSVNLRGEFHVENVTAFDPLPKRSEHAIKPMDIDTEGLQQVSSGAQTPSSITHEIEQSQRNARNTPSTSKSTKSPKPTEALPDLDTLYPTFWSLQSFFSSPTRLFEPVSMRSFKDSIQSTLSCFKSVSFNSNSSSTSSSSPNRGSKRKRSTTIDATFTSTSTASTFNPKYLTNRDLFDLEIHDIAFRRHILVQALIIIDFLLSLTSTAKPKMADTSNKSVSYTFTLSDEDAKWAHSTRSAIATYLQQGNSNEGRSYYRMVDMVLSRDKNWVRWKAESCPSISRPPVDVQAHLSAQKTLAELTTKKPLPPPPGATDLDFLSKVEPMEALKNPSSRHHVPTMEEYYKGIQGDELDMDFATEEEKKEIEERKAGKVWRALRSSGRRFVLCEKIQNGTNLKALINGDESWAKGEGEDEKKEESKNDINGADGEGDNSLQNVDSAKSEVEDADYPTEPPETEAGAGEQDIAMADPEAPA